MSERSERNRKIAEWLEPSETLPDSFDPDQDGVMVDPHYSPMRCWYWQSVYAHGDRIERFHVDFYTSEEASALVLEKLIMLNCRVLIDRGGTTIYGPPQPDDVLVLYDARGHKFDLELWRTAIAECALRLIEETGGQRT